MRDSNADEFAAALWKRFGVRNFAYIAFVVLMVPFGMAVEAAGPQGPDRGGGVWATLLVWGIVSLVFFVVNAILLVVALVKGRPTLKPLIACGLPFAAVFVGMILAGI